MTSVWRRTETKADGDTFRRPLGDTELKFYWDTVFNGVAISIQHIELEPESAFTDDLFSRENIESSWIRLKQRFPLLGASVEELPGSDVVEFVVNEHSLTVIKPEEVKYVTFTSSEEISQFLDRLLNGTPTLTNELLAQLWIGPQVNATQTRYHVFVPVAHHITDGTGNATLTKEFCQELSLLSTKKEVDGVSLSERLSLLLPLEALNATTGLTKARQRWRSAIAKVIYNIRMAKLKGGHTLPTISKVDPRRPAHSKTLTLTLPASVSRQIIESCRSLGITFGNALPVLSQLAHTRMLLKSRTNSAYPHISDEEWENRRVQPMIFAGPLNLRPYLNRSWFENGGDKNLCLAISFYFFTLPSMPTYKAESSILDINRRQTVSEWFNSPRDSNAYLSDVEEPDNVLLSSLKKGEIPAFSSLMTPARFLLRALMIRAQSSQLFRHPLLHELHTTRMSTYIKSTREVGLAWRAKQSGCQQEELEPLKTPQERPFVTSNGGASLGNRDLILSYEYPLQNTQESPPIRLRIADYLIHLRCRPSELYLGALTMRGKMQFFSYSDANIYDPLIVKEWMDEVCNAAMYYLVDQKAKSKL